MFSKNYIIKIIFLNFVLINIFKNNSALSNNILNLSSLHKNLKKSKAIASNTIEISGIDQYNKIINNQKPSIVKFYRIGCPACQMMIPIYKDIAKQYSDKINFIEINIANKNLISLIKKYKITLIPTFIFLKDHIINKHIGTARPDYLKNLIENYLL